MELVMESIYLIILYLPSPFENSAQNTYLNKLPNVVAVSIKCCRSFSGWFAVTGRNYYVMTF